MSKDIKPNRHDGDRDGQGIYQPDKTENPQATGTVGTRKMSRRSRTIRKRTTKGESW